MKMYQVDTLLLVTFVSPDGMLHAWILFSLPKLSNSNIVAREPISSIEGLRRWFFSFGWPASTTEPTIQLPNINENN